MKLLLIILTVWVMIKLLMCIIAKIMYSISIDRYYVMEANNQLLIDYKETDKSYLVSDYRLKELHESIERFNDNVEAKILAPFSGGVIFFPLAVRSVYTSIKLIGKVIDQQKNRIAFIESIYDCIDMIKNNHPDIVKQIQDGDLTTLQAKIAEHSYVNGDMPDDVKQNMVSDICNEIVNRFNDNTDDNE